MEFWRRFTSCEGSIVAISLGALNPVLWSLLLHYLSVRTFCGTLLGDVPDLDQAAHGKGSYDLRKF